MRLLECTLRDGSYSVDFQFTAADTALIVNRLDSAGVSLIELGHGAGTFNRQLPKHYQFGSRQGATDEEYLAAARKAAGRAKLGVITGVFAIDALPMLVKHKFDFVRLAAMANQMNDPATHACIERAKSLGLTCSINLMQTVAMTPSEVAEASVRVAKAGGDWFYIVDSAGGMMPNDVKEYVRAVRDASGLTVGLHAHHNTGLGVANCLAAIEAGATLVDATLQGMGREVGNAPTEQLLLVLQKLGYEREVLVDPVFELGDQVRALLESKGNNPTYYATGIAELHSANLKGITQFAADRGISVRALLAAISQGDKKIVGFGLTSFSEDVIDPALARIPKTPPSEPPSELVAVFANEVERASTTELPALATALYARAKKQHLTSVLHVVPADHAPHVRPLPWLFDRYCGVTVPVEGKWAADLGDRQPDVVVIDPSLSAEAFASHKCVVPDSFVETVADAAVAVVSALKAITVWVIGATPPVEDLVRRRLDMIKTGVVRFAPLAPNEWASDVRSTDAIILAGRADDAQRERIAATGARMLRPAIGPVIGARIATSRWVEAQLAASGSGAFVGPLAAAGRGQIVVDNPECPSSVIEGSEELASLVDKAARQRLKALLAGRGGM